MRVGFTSSSEIEREKWGLGWNQQLQVFYVLTAAVE